MKTLWNVVKNYSCAYAYDIWTCAVFHITLTWSPVVSGHCQSASDFQKYSPGLANAKGKLKWKNKKKMFFPKIYKCYFIICPSQFPSG